MLRKGRMKSRKHIKDNMNHCKMTQLKTACSLAPALPTDTVKPEHRQRIVELTLPVNAAIARPIHKSEWDDPVKSQELVPARDKYERKALGTRTYGTKRQYESGQNLQNGQEEKEKMST